MPTDRGSERNDDGDTSKKEAQELASKMRMKYLRGLSAMFGKTATLTLYGNLQTVGTLMAYEPSQNCYYVQDLQTKLGVQKHAFIRGSDVLAVKVDVPGDQESE